MVCSGLSDVIGSWKIIEMRSPRTACSCAGFELQEVLALEPDFARRVRGGGIGQQLQDRQRRDGLAGAGLADQRHRLALADAERHA